MSGFNYEKNQPHQMRAVSAVLGVFDGATPKYRAADENPELLFAAKQYPESANPKRHRRPIPRPFGRPKYP